MYDLCLDVFQGLPMFSKFFDKRTKTTGAVKNIQNDGLVNNHIKESLAKESHKPIIRRLLKKLCF